MKVNDGGDAVGPKKRVDMKSVGDALEKVAILLCWEKHCAYKEDRTILKSNRYPESDSGQVYFVLFIYFKS